MSRLPPDSASVTYVGRQVAGVNARLDALERQSAVDTITTVGIPVIDNIFSPIYAPGKKAQRDQIFVSLKFANFGNADDLKVVLVSDADILTSDDYDQKRIPCRLADGLDDNARTAQSAVSQLDVPLTHATHYYVIRLVAIAEGVARAANPDDVTGPPAYAGYPGNALYDFTTPDLATSLPIGPNMVNGGGMMNSFDQYNVLYGAAPVVADQDYLGRNWQTFSNSGVRIDRLVGGTLVSAGMQWLDTKGFLKMATGMQGLGGKPACKLRKQIKPGETYTFSCLLAADSAVNNVKITIALVDQASGDIVALTTAANWLFSVITSWTPTLIAILKVPAGYAMAGKQWIEMRYTANTSDVTYTTHWKLERGEGASIWVPHTEEDLLDAQSNITAPSGTGAPGSGGIGFYGSDGTKFGGDDGSLIGGLVY